MPYEDVGKIVSREAGVDLTGSQYCFLALKSDGTVTLCGDGARPFGVLQNNPKLGEAASVMVGRGITKVKVAAAVTKTRYAACGDSSGRAVMAATGDYYAGEFLEDAGGINEIAVLDFTEFSKLA
jgi:hypothetical protein